MTHENSHWQAAIKQIESIADGWPERPFKSLSERREFEAYQRGLRVALYTLHRHTPDSGAGYESEVDSSGQPITGGQGGEQTSEEMRLWRDCLHGIGRLLVQPLHPGYDPNGEETPVNHDHAVAILESFIPPCECDVPYFVTVEGHGVVRCADCGRLPGLGITTRAHILPKRTQQE
jgi:hypothetical protein